MDNKPTQIHGIAASENIDSSSEKIIIDGLDISSLTIDGTFNYEHQSDSASKIVGKITEAHKISSKDDCENQHHLHFWNKVKMPFLYVRGELFDSAGHDQAKAVAAMLRYDEVNNNIDTRNVVNFSIEGSRLEMDGKVVKKAIARKVSITITPCNKVCVAEKVIENKEKEATDSLLTSLLLGKSEANCGELFKGDMNQEQWGPKRNKVPKLPISPTPPNRNNSQIQKSDEYTSTKSWSDQANGVKKQTVAKPAVAPKPPVEHNIEPKPNTAQGALATPKQTLKPTEIKPTDKLAPGTRISYNKPKTKSARQMWEEHFNNQANPEIKKEEINNIWTRYKNKDELLSFIKNKNLNLSEESVLDIAKNIAVGEEFALEDSITKLIED